MDIEIISTFETISKWLIFLYMSPCAYMWEFSLEFIPRSGIFRSQMCAPSILLEKKNLYFQNWLCQFPRSLPVY